MARRRKPVQHKVDLNLTSMMDVVFLLIVFFILVTNFTTAENVDLDPPEPEESQALDAEDRDRVVINIIPDGASGRAAKVRVGIRDIDPGDYGTLTTMLEREHESNPTIEVDLRADKSLAYGQVQPVMDAITAAGIGRINLVALLETGGSGD